MKRIGVVAGLLVAIWLIAIPCWGQAQPQRPKILGISGVQIYESNMAAAWRFYSPLTDMGQICVDCEKAPDPDFFDCGTQTIAISALSKPKNSDLLQFVALRTDNLNQLSAYLRNKGVRSSKKNVEPYGKVLFVYDPEGHVVLFADASHHKLAVSEKTVKNPQGSCRLIHAGWVVKDREAMDKFYKDVLGFHLYWQGGMKDDQVDWVSMQVPDGTDWIEYMLNIPPDADKHLLGVMNHIALGVPSVQAAAERLKKRGVKLTEEPKIGRDGKWQLNLYDPDDTRVELMEFTPVEKPCCSEFTGTHPKP